ncbi:MAG: hypothetical protein JXR91_09450 [Deltaproteobacteria bacterium]|nr:hypothetical protein [Deltaproteobacteria bacterium]
MGTSFDITKLIDVAIADERSGIELYKALANKAKNEELKGVFNTLSAVEEVHCSQFETMNDELKKDPSKGAYPDEYVDYLEALSAEGGKSDAFARIDASKDDVELLNLSIEFEKEQLSLQKDIGEALGDKYQPIIDKIIKEERDHLVVLSRAKKKIPLSL